MLFHVVIFGFVIIFFCSPVSTGADDAKTSACDAVFNPDAMKIACCDPMKQLVDVHLQCLDKSCSEEFTCSVSHCVANIYNITTHNKIDETKCRAVLTRLSKEMPESKPLNDKIMENCLYGQYKQYVTSDPECDTMKYQVCAFVNYFMGCQKFNESSCRCKKLSENVNTCKPYLRHYLKFDKLYQMLNISKEN